MLVLIVACHFGVEILGSPRYEILESEAPAISDDSLYQKLIRVRIGVFFFLTVVDLYFARMHFVLLVIYSIVHCCVTGDEDQLDRIFPADSNQVPGEDRPSIVQPPGRFDIEMASPAQ